MEMGRSETWKWKRGVNEMCVCCCACIVPACCKSYIKEDRQAGRMEEKKRKEKERNEPKQTYTHAHTYTSKQTY
jgi:hypothetical protein